MKNINLNSIVKILSLVVVLATSFFVCSVFYLEIFASQQSSDFGQEIAVWQSKVSNKPIRMLFFGDMMLDRHVGERIKKYGLDYIFEKLASSTEENFFLDYDLIGCNLEGAVTNNGAYYNPIMSYDFAFAPDLIEQLKKYNFNFFNLANNHFADQGERGIIETRNNLDEIGINYSGCKDGKIGDCSYKILNIANKKIGIAGFSMVYGKFDIEKTNNIARQLASTTDWVIVNIHWGAEYEHQFNKIQQKTAHNLIDAGADIIIGHHPHVVQGIEAYKNKLIFYSLGNFIFDQYFSRDTQAGLAVEINITDNNIQFFLYPIKSKQSQVELMSGEEKEKFLSKLADLSQVNEEYKEKIIKGVLNTQIYPPDREVGHGE